MNLNAWTMTVLDLLAVSVCRNTVAADAADATPNNANNPNGQWASSPLGVCQHAQELAIFEASQTVACDTRGPVDTLVRLSLPNASYLDMTPREVMVKRCAGSCVTRAHTCIPLNVTSREVKVLLTTNKPPGRGLELLECAVAIVEEHLRLDLTLRLCGLCWMTCHPDGGRCGCGCPVSREACAEGHFEGIVGGPRAFYEEECKCDCADRMARNSCFQNNKFWDDSTCSCFCLPQDQWPLCPSGYTFDYRAHGECTCISHSTTASLVLELMVMIVIVGLVFISYKLCSCYKSKTGLFQAMYDQSLEDRRFSLFYQGDHVSPTGNAATRSPERTTSELFLVTRVKTFFVNLTSQLQNFMDIQHPVSRNRNRGPNTTATSVTREN